MAAGGSRSRELGILAGIAAAAAVVDALLFRFAVDTAVWAASAALALGLVAGVLAAAALTLLPDRPRPIGARAFVVVLAAFLLPWIVAAQGSH